MRGQILTEHHLKYFEYLVSSRSAKWLALRGQLSCPIIHVQGPALRSHVTAQCHYVVIMAERAMQSDVWYLHWDVLSVNCQHAFQKMFAKMFEQLHKKLGAWTREISCTEYVVTWSTNLVSNVIQMSSSPWQPSRCDVTHSITRDSANCLWPDFLYRMTPSASWNTWELQHRGSSIMEPFGG